MDDFLDFGGYGSYLDQYDSSGGNWWDDIGGSGDYSYGGDQWTVEDPQAYADWSKYIDYDPETGTFTNRLDPSYTEHYDPGSGEWLDPSYWQGGTGGSGSSGGSSGTNWMRQLAMGQLPEGLFGDLLGGALFGGGLYNTFQNNELYKDQIKNQIGVNQQNADTTKFRADTERLLADQNILGSNRDYVQQGMTNYRGLTSDLSNQALMEYYARTQPQKAQMMMGLVQAGNPDFAMNPMLQGGLSQYTANQNALADILKGYGGDYSSLRDRINLPGTVNYDILNGGSGQSPIANDPIAGIEPWDGSNLTLSSDEQLELGLTGGFEPWNGSRSSDSSPNSSIFGWSGEQLRDQLNRFNPMGQSPIVNDPIMGFEPWNDDPNFMTRYERPAVMSGTMTPGGDNSSKVAGRGMPNLDRYIRSYSGTRG